MMTRREMNSEVTLYSEVAKVNRATIQVEILDRELDELLLRYHRVCERKQVSFRNSLKIRHAVLVETRDQYNKYIMDKKEQIRLTLTLNHVDATIPFIQRMVEGLHL